MRRRTTEPLRVEWPTVLVALTIYLGWGLATWFHDRLPWWLLAMLGGWLIAWQGSLQHETIHGHPTTSRTANAAFGWPPLALWMPYPIYRTLHITHHRDRRLTQPATDPESFYVTPQAWQAMPAPARWMLLVNHTFAGRLLLGPAVAVTRFAVAEVRLLARGDRWRRQVWLTHALSVSVVGVWVTGVAGMPLWLYVVTFVYPGIALTLMRSFAEHRAPRTAGQGASAVVTAGPVLSLLYLNNNLHVAHHARPAVAWYRLPALNREIGGAERAAHGAGLFRGYHQLAGRYLVRPVDHPVHPGRPKAA